jgi:hypothetical protein
MSLCLQEQVLNNYEPEISFCIVDLKFNSSIKICEFGEGSRSVFKGFDHLYGRGKIWTKLWKFLGQFNLPIWFVNQDTDDKHKHDFAFEEFEKINGCFVPSIISLQKNPLFLAIANKKNNKIKKNIFDYNAIVILKNNGYLNPATIDFKINFPNVLLLNDATGPFINDKFLTTNLFEDDLLRKYRPKFKVYKKKYSKTLSKEIIQELKSDYYVIKPVNASKGSGVIIVNKDKLDHMLYLILAGNSQLDVSNPSYSYWLSDKNDIFLVEEFVTSKCTFWGNKPYDATMRVVFIIYNNLNCINIEFLGSYWKLPNLSLIETGEFVEKHKSHVDPSKVSSLIVSQEDFKAVKVMLSGLLESVYVKMLESRAHAHESIKSYVLKKKTL